MAGGNGRRGGERVLESRHLMGLFLGVVLLCGVFFTLGYVMGRAQYSSGSVVGGAASEKEPAAVPAGAAAKSAPSGKPAPEDTSGWEIYSNNPSDKLESLTKAAPASSQPAKRDVSAPATPKPVAPSDRAPARFQSPRIPKGAIVLQIAALTRESDALALADVLQQKKYPSFVVTPATDNYYRVQVGPYSGLGAAEQAKRALERQGFKSIIKH